MPSSAPRGPALAGRLQDRLYSADLRLYRAAPSAVLRRALGDTRIARRPDPLDHPGEVLRGHLRDRGAPR